MSLWDQMLALRTPAAVKESPEDWNAHICNTVLPFLNSVTSKQMTASSAPDAFSVLNPVLDTLPFLYALYERASSALAKSKSIPASLLPGGDLWEVIARFITESDPIETRYGGERWRWLMELLPEVAHQGKASQVPVLQYMAAAMLKLDPSCGTLTSTHLLFVRTCMEQQAYAEALLVLDHDIHSLPAKESIGNPALVPRLYLSNAYITTQSKLTAALSRNDILEYFTLGAMAYIALRQWSRALHFLEHVLSTPTNNTANGAMLEAYKKWVLVSLMARGTTSSTPKAANSNAMRTVRQAARYYDSFADAFALEDGRKLAAEAHEAWSWFVEDGNSGLVTEVIHHHRRLSVSQLARIYAAVPLETVARKLEMPAAETQTYLQSLISEGFLRASIEHGGQGGERVLRFFHNGREERVERTEEKLSEELLEQTGKIKSLAAHVSEADRRLSLSKEYLEHTRNARRNKDAQREGGVDDTDAPFAGRPASEDEDDENVMADVR